MVGVAASLLTVTDSIKLVYKNAADKNVWSFASDISATQPSCSNIKQRGSVIVEVCSSLSGGSQTDYVLRTYNIDESGKLTVGTSWTLDDFGDAAIVGFGSS